MQESTKAMLLAAGYDAETVARFALALAEIAETPDADEEAVAARHGVCHEDLWEVLDAENLV